ncbi:MAG: phosphoribosylamine--glycine ligase [Planctomycetota bacterium]
MKVLIVGGGGREHALAWKIRQSPLVKRLYCAPGNPGIAKHADLVSIGVEDMKGLLTFARRERIDFTVVGPEVSLALGIVDEFQAERLRIFGPTREAAELESSKAFAKNMFRRHNIPTAGYRVFDRKEEALAYLEGIPYPAVLKADGLAAGKGTILCYTFDHAAKTVADMMEKKVFGEAGAKVVVEEFLTGVEVSVLALTDAKTILVLETAQDHKRRDDGDKGPNTGGMGAYSPAPFLTEEGMRAVEREVLVPTVHAMKREKRRFTGLLYAGLMMTKDAPKTLEYNVRFGDPETQPLMARMKSDILPVLMATVDGTLDKCTVEWGEKAAMCVVLATGGYPASAEKGVEITGVDEAEKVAGVQVFHAGTAMKDGKLVTAGGRVLGVTAVGESIGQARERAYEAVSAIHFDRMHYRKDIGHQAMVH